MPAQLPILGPRAAEIEDQFDLNTATVNELSAIPRLGTIKAQAIVDYRQTMFRTEHRGFLSVDELHRVKGFGPATLDLIRPFVYVRR
ncbi:MAG: helix-hairpin-helix domain-containing protein [Phycisphaerae bacterium]|nr:helix-hairpin-helix domain-containing protein [Phycisphaerae bacterium]